MDSAFLQSCHIVVHQAGKHYPGHGEGEGLWAVRDLTLCARPGEFAAVVGPSGCGKSTLLSLLAGFEPATEGKVMLEGRPVAGPGPDRGVVFQEDALFPWLTVLGNVCYGLHRRGLSRPEARDEAMRFLRLVGLEEFADYYPSQLSGGMRQRVALARVLANRPRALLMDEPFGALDALTRMEMQQLLLDVWQKLNVTVLFVTHDVEEAIFLADRVYVMTARPGRVLRRVEVGLPRPRTPDTYTDPALTRLRHEVLDLLLEARNPSVLSDAIYPY